MNEINIQEQIAEKRKDAYIELSESWGHEYPGYSGIIITKNNEVYRYQEYSQIPEELKDLTINFFSKDETISNEIRNKLEKYIDEQIICNDFPPEIVFDAGWDVKIYFENIITIQNYKEIYDDLMRIINEK